jgi:hypothetical protein
MVRRHDGARTAVQMLGGDFRRRCTSVTNEKVLTGWTKTAAAALFFNYQQRDARTSESVSAPEFRTPMRRMYSGCCACAASAHAVASEWLLFGSYLASINGLTGHRS